MKLLRELTIPIIATIVLKGTGPVHILVGSSSVGHSTDISPKLMEGGRFIALSPHRRRRSKATKKEKTLPYVLDFLQNNTNAN